MSTSLTPQQIQHLDQAAVDALSDVDQLAADPETTRRLTERGEAVYGFELTRDLYANGLNAWSLAAWAAFATIRLNQANRRADALLDELTAVRTELAKVQGELATTNRSLDGYRADERYAGRAALIEYRDANHRHNDRAPGWCICGDEWDAEGCTEYVGLTEAMQLYTGERAAGSGYLIWSHHHHMWFGGNGQGYRSQIGDAGRYTEAATKQWLSRGCHCCLVPEVAVPAPLRPITSAAIRELIATATDAAIEAGQINKHANCGEVGTSFTSDNEPVYTEPCRLPYDHNKDHDWAQREAAEATR